jgi:ribosome-binding factor A
LIRNTIGQLLLSKISDPRIDPARTSVTRVEVSEDLAGAKVYISVVGTEAKQRLAVQALRHAAGYIQELMARQIQLRNTPLLDFQTDKKFKETLQTLAIIDEAMREIRHKEGSGDLEASPEGEEAEE